MNIELRAARDSDAYALWVWANDPETRKASFHQGRIDWEDHIQWMNGDRWIYVAVNKDTGQPVGTFRAELRENGSTEGSWTVAPEARRQGVARAIAEKAKRLCSHVRCKPGNPSIHVANAVGIPVFVSTNALMRGTVASPEGES